MTKDCGVYKIINTTTGDFYVGSSVNLKERLQTHRCELRKNKHGNARLQRSWNKYGEEAFSFQVILLCDPSNKLFYEQRLIDGLKPDFNLAKDALAPMQGRKHTREAREKIGKACTGRVFSDEVRKQRSERMSGVGFFSGKKHSDETKKKISLSKMGKCGWPVGHKHTEESKKKISLSKKGVPNPHAVGKKYCLGKKHSDETKKKMSETHKRIWAARKAGLA